MIVNPPAQPPLKKHLYVFELANSLDVSQTIEKNVQFSPLP